MRRFIVCLLTALAFSTTSTYAGPGSDLSHTHATPATKEKVLKNALSAVAAIVKKNKIEASWAEVKHSEAKKKMFKHGQEWVVTFDNPKVSNQKKKTLYVFISLDGQYLGANFSGN